MLEEKESHDQEQLGIFFKDRFYLFQCRASLSLEYANVHYENQRGGFKRKCFLNMFDHRELPGHKPSLVNADMCKERQVSISCLSLLWEKELY